MPSKKRRVLLGIAVVALAVVGFNAVRPTPPQRWMGQRVRDGEATSVRYFEGPESASKCDAWTTIPECDGSRLTCWCDKAAAR